MVRTSPMHFAGAVTRRAKIRSKNLHAVRRVRLAWSAPRLSGLCLAATTLRRTPDTMHYGPQVTDPIPLTSVIPQTMLSFSSAPLSSRDHPPRKVHFFSYLPITLICPLSFCEDAALILPRERLYSLSNLPEAVARPVDYISCRDVNPKFSR